jgi:methionyl-tRNA formyltransferase
MVKKKLKIVVWCGSASNQKALANKIAEEFVISGIVIDNHSRAGKKKRMLQLPALLWEHFRFRKIYNAWKSLLKYYDSKFPKWPDLLMLRVSSINCEQTELFTRQCQPDLIIVSGTGLIKEPLLSMNSSIGIINLHTGLSPYVKGGPNCTNWCIARNEFQLVGNTIMWLNAGIDAGNIITSETVDIKSAGSLAEAHRIVMDHAHDLYLRTIRYLLETEPPYNSVPQSLIGKGELYLTKMWRGPRKKELLKNWEKRKLTFPYQIPRTISLPGGNGG